MEKTTIADGVSLVEVPEAGLSILCGCPENVVKHLMKAGKIAWVEKDGKRRETGPNAILLSERPIMGGRFANAAEFPVLQMLYRQGMILPGNATGPARRPMLIGLREQLESQARYIYLGNYGLSSREELMAAGMDATMADERLQMKLAFALGSIKPTDELLDLRVVDARAVELRDGAFVRRLGLNRYSIIHKGESVDVDLEVTKGPMNAPYALPSSPAPKADFAVVHLGEGDGWDPERPCMGAVVVHRGEYWLVDAGPNIQESLAAVGLRLCDLRGVFHTHIHDDHFIGLAALFRAPHRLRYAAVPWVRAAAAKKLSALAAIEESEFSRYFEVRDLVEGSWNDVDGLEVLPLYSPHPVETTILRFRAFGRTYAHWADLSSFRVLDSMTRPDPAAPGISAEVAARVKADYLEPADVKKVDVGGGLIHGDADDFSSDSSGELLLSHTDSRGAVKRGWGRVAEFGEVTTFQPLASVSLPRSRASAPGKVVSALRAAGLFDADFPEECQWQLASAAKESLLEPGADLVYELGRGMVVVEEGEAELMAAREALARLGPGDIFGEERVLRDEAPFFGARALGTMRVLFVPEPVIEEMPALLWHLKELHERRHAAAKARFHFVWRPDYAVGVDTIDEAHRRIFAGVAALSEAWKQGRDLEGIEASVQELRVVVREHYADEERLMEEAGYPGLGEHARIHAEIIAEIDIQAMRIKKGEADLATVLDMAKDRLLEHSLLIDRQYIPWLLGKEGRKGKPTT